MQEKELAVGHEVEKKPIVSTDKVLRMIRFHPKSFGGIHEKMNLVIVFDDPSKRIVGLEGDQGQCKTSALEALYASFGGTEPKNAINSEDKVKDVDLVFEKGPDRYQVRLTKGSFTVTKHDPEGNKAKMDAPKDFLKRLIGPIGLNPMDLKNMKGKEQVKWLRDLTTLTPEQLKQEADILSQKEDKYNKRTDINREAKQLHAELLQTGYYLYEEEKRTFTPTDVHKENVAVLASSVLDEVQLEATFKEVDKRKKDWEKEKENLVILQSNEQKNLAYIANLEEDLRVARLRAIELSNQIEACEKTCNENGSVEKEYDKAFKDIQELSKLKLLEKSLSDSAEKMSVFKEKVTQSEQLSKEIDEYTEQHKQFIKLFTPTINDFDVVVPGVEDSKKREEGLYYKDKTMLMLSESELFELYIQLLDSQNVRICIIENITSLGSQAIEKINWFVEQRGGYVFYSAMQRGQEKMSVQFLDKIS